MAILLHQRNIVFFQPIDIDMMKSGSVPTEDLDRALTCWVDDFSARLSQDKSNAGIIGINEAEEVKELNEIIKFAREHVIEKDPDRLA